MSVRSGMAIKIASFFVLASFSVGYLGIISQSHISSDILSALLPIPLVGLIGATIANASGTGGGVVFLPIFHTLNAGGQINLSPTNILAASFIIQCFGMSMGSLIWSRGIALRPASRASIPLLYLWKIAAILLCAALPIMLATQYFLHPDERLVLLAFKLFSIALGVALVFSTLQNRRNSSQDLKQTITKNDLYILIALSLIGGFANALFSVGLGEIVALYLFLRGYCITTSSGLAVFISAVSVLVGAPYHIANGNVPWEVVAFAAPGALMGGFFARRIALYLGAFRLKLMAGSWIALSGVGLLFLQLG